MSIIQIEVFELIEGVSDESFIASDEIFEQWCYANCPGIVRRTTARDDHSWLVLTLWARPQLYEAENSERTEWFKSVNASTWRSSSFTTLS